ncbi:MAG: hypothetical protein D6689_21425 [Deltaproteobacteria bacterium]|nr:MAG: hypothetical protein D6689_21425 [Deltaproteobacteria bacterium]
MRAWCAAAIAGLAGFAAGCSPRSAAVDAAAGADAVPPYPPPRTDLVPAVGTASAIDVATWNVENFPKTPQTPRLVADLIASLDLDVVALQEIASVDAFDELVARLRGYDGVLSPHTYSDGSYQKIGIVYRRDVVSVDDVRLLLSDHGYELPRPPLAVEVSIAGSSLDFRAVAVHLKAGFDADDRSRRAAAVALIEAEVAMDPDPEVVVVGDFNEVVTSDAGRAVFAPFFDAADHYVVLTDGLAQSGAETFLPSGAMIDHAVATADLAASVAADTIDVPPLADELVGYRDAVSDHLPVVIAVTP